MPSSNHLSVRSPESEQDEIMDGQKLHQLLLQVSREEAARGPEREEAIARNRARAMQLLAVLEKSQA